MNTIGFLGQVKDTQIKELENKGVLILNKNKLLIEHGLNFIRENLKNLNVNCDWEAGYEGGIVEFVIESENSINLEVLKDRIKNFS